MAVPLEKADWWVMIAARMVRKNRPHGVVDSTQVLSRTRRRRLVRHSSSDRGRGGSRMAKSRWGYWRVLVTRRPKYACRACESAVVDAPAPERLIKGGLPTEAMVAHVLVSKYAWHLPLYRQAQMLAAVGILIDRSTLAFWVGYGANLTGKTKELLDSRLQ